MDTRVLGKDLTVSAVGLRCMGFSHGYGTPTDEKEAIRLLRRAFDMGYTFFDTAEVYGTADSPHINEELVGKALAPIRDQVIIATKFGLRFDFNSGKVPVPLIPDSRPEAIRKSVEGSLKRPGTDHIDLYFRHRTDPAVDPEAVAGVMADLIKEGKVTHRGISEANEDYLRRANAICPVTAVQNRYSMMARHYESLFPTLEELGVGLVAFSPMANGFLTGKYGKGQHFDPTTDYRATMPQFTDEAVERNTGLLKLLDDMAEEKNATQAQISMAWMLCKKPWIVPWMLWKCQRCSGELLFPGKEWKRQNKFMEKNNMKRPIVICHMLVSPDGKIDGDFFDAPDTAAALKAYGELRSFYGCQATLYGTTTMLGGYADGRVCGLSKSERILPKEDFVSSEGKATGNFIVSVDPKGILAFSSNLLEKKGRPAAHVIEALTGQASPEYLSYLRNLGVSYLFAGDERIDCGVLLQKLSKLFGIEKLMVAGGGVVNWSFLASGLIDEPELGHCTDGRRGERNLSQFLSNLSFCPTEALYRFI